MWPAPSQADSEAPYCQAAGPRVPRGRIVGKCLFRLKLRDGTIGSSTTSPASPPKSPKKGRVNGTKA